MNWVYVGDHPAQPHEYGYECPECFVEFDEPEGLRCPDCGTQVKPDPEDTL